MGRHRKGGRRSETSEEHHHGHRGWRGKHGLFVGTRHKDLFQYSEENSDRHNDWILGFRPKSDGDILDITTLLGPGVTLDTLNNFVKVKTFGCMTRLTIDVGDSSATKHIWLVGTRIRGIDELKDLAVSRQFVFSNE